MNSEIKELENQILYHKRKYFDGEPVISDEAYDTLENRLRELHPDSPVLFIVGIPIGGTVSHDPPMLSCQKAKTVDEVLKWAAGRELYMGYKIDGLSLKLVYEEGKLVEAATRGNGLAGDAVSINIMKVQGIPKTIPVKERTEIRGELYMTISEFNRLNMNGNGPSYSSPRNLAAGTIKQKDPKILDERKLEFMSWDLITSTSLSIEDSVNLLKSWNFESSDFKLIKNPDKQTIETLFDKIKNERDDLDFEIDGAVFKYNQVSDRESAGYTEHHPRWQIALKFESKGEITVLKDIIWQVGRTGVLTPVAELEPVEVAGAVISRATLHNADFLADLNANIGDLVSIERSGDVIPKVLGVVKKKSEGSVAFPDKCPSCRSPVVKDSSVNLVCTASNNCRDRDIQQILYWIRIVDIKGLGSKSVEKLYDEGIIKHYSDLYALTEQQLVSKLGKNGEKVYKNIDDTRELPFHIFLAALGVQSLGRRLGKVLANHYGSFEELQGTSIQKLNEIEGISDLTAGYILNGINDPQRYEGLFQNGLTVIYTDKKARKKLQPQRQKTLLDYINGGEEIQDTANGSDSLELATIEKFQKVYVTGKVAGYSKKDLQAFVEDHGFEWSASISGNLDYLVTGESAGAKKLEKAEKLGITVLSWEEFVSNHCNYAGTW
ncbi:MAG: NAD-dependent DNA ligase LigA [Candidatus Odinarchaeota archaeon]